jgi:hypothetical protein
LIRSVATASPSRLTATVVGFTIEPQIFALVTTVENVGQTAPVL